MVKIIDVFKHGGPLSKCIEQFEPRQGQVVMAETVAEVLSNLVDAVA